MTDKEIEDLKDRVKTLEIRYNELIKYIKNIRPMLALQPIETEEAKR